MDLTIGNVKEVFEKCLFSDGEDTSTAVLADGIISNFGFNPMRLEENKSNVESMLLQLPKEFMKDSGGGWSFLNACNNSAGEQWGEHKYMEQLVSLGVASGAVKYLLPKSMWGSLPGGMPYFVVNLPRQ